MKTLLATFAFFVALFAAVECHPITPPPSAPPDATSPPPLPVIDASDETPAAVDAPSPLPPTPPCDAGQCCAVCAHLALINCAKPSCVSTCQATLQFHVLNLDCLVNATTAAAVAKCGVTCSP